MDLHNRFQNTQKTPLLGRNGVFISIIFELETNRQILLKRGEHLVVLLVHLLVLEGLFRVTVGETEGKIPFLFLTFRHELGDQFNGFKDGDTRIFNCLTDGACREVSRDR